MAVNTYYFDGSDAAASDPNNVWSNETNADDGSTSTSATTVTSGSISTNYLQIEGTNAPASSDSITQVRARVYGAYTSSLDRHLIYTDGRAEALFNQSSILPSTAGWSSYATLTVPTGGWTWAKVQALEYVTFLTLSSTLVSIYRAEIEVTSDTPEYFKSTPISETITSSGVETEVIMESDE